MVESFRIRTGGDFGAPFAGLILNLADEWEKSRAIVRAHRIANGAMNRKGTRWVIDDETRVSGLLTTIRILRKTNKDAF